MVWISPSTIVLQNLSALPADIVMLNPKAQYPNKGIDYMKYLPIDATSSHNANLNILWQHSWKLYRLGIGIYGRYQSTRRYINDNNADGFQTWRINTATHY